MGVAEYDAMRAGEPVSQVRMQDGIEGLAILPSERRTTDCPDIAMNQPDEAILDLDHPRAG